MTSVPRAGAALLLVFLGAPLLLAQARPIQGQETDAREDWALRLMVGEAGLGIGHVPRITGLRINWSDRSLDLVRGVNLTIWRAGNSVGGRVRGLAMGGVPQAGVIQGLGLGLGVVAEDHLAGLHLGAIASISGAAMDGVSAGGIATVSGSRMEGIHVGGLAAVAGTRARGMQAALLATVAGDDMEGMQLGGLGAVAGTDVRGVQGAGLAVVGGYRVEGIQLAGLAVVAGGNRMAGLQAGGLAVVSGERLSGVQLGGLAVIGGGGSDGIQLAGLATVAGGDARGIKMGGLATIAGERLDGVQLGGLGTVAGCRIRGLQASLGVVEVRRDLMESGLPSREDPATVRPTCVAPGIVGITLAGYRIRGASSRGLTAALAWLDVKEIWGLSVGGFQRSGLQVGLAVGVVNWTDRLHGLQLGLVNRAGNNPPPFRILPLLNLNFSD